MPLISSNKYLSVAEMTDNAQYILNYFLAKGWTKNAVCGMLGNMQRESTINPGVWQNLDYGNYSVGYGLVQWTPATNFTNWASSNNYEIGDINAQCERIIYELENNLQWIATDTFNYSFSEFTKKTDTPETLAHAFLLNYERAGVGALDERKANALYWFNNLSGEGGVYTPRLTVDGIQGSKYWYSNTNPFYAADLGLPNCTCYAWGRFWEIGDHSGEGENIPTLPTGDGGAWWGAVNGYDTGQTPQLGAVACFSDNNGAAGHVAIVEEIDSDGNITTSNSAYGSTYFYTQNLSKASNYNHSHFTFQGFIYNPHAFGGYTPTPSPANKKKKKFNFIFYKKRRVF